MQMEKQIPKILAIIFWNFTLFSWNFPVFYYWLDWPKVKQELISSITNLVYELPNGLMSDLELRILKKLQNIR